MTCFDLSTNLIIRLDRPDRWRFIYTLEFNSIFLLSAWWASTIKKMNMRGRKSFISKNIDESSNLQLRAKKET